MTTAKIGIVLIVMGTWSIVGWQIIERFKLFYPGVGFAFWFIPIGIYMVVSSFLKRKKL